VLFEKRESTGYAFSFRHKRKYDDDDDDDDDDDKKLRAYPSAISLLLGDASYSSL